MAEKSITRAQLEDIILDLIGDTSVTKVSPNISKHIAKLTLEDGMTFMEIARCLVWSVEVYEHPIDPLYGILFIRNIREQAAQYFKQLELDQQKQKNAAKKVVEYQDNNIIFNIRAMQHKKRKPKQFNIEEINVLDEGDDIN